MCKRFLLCFGTFLLSGIIFALCFVGVDVSAAETITKMSIADTRAFFGDNIPAKARVTGSAAWQNTTFTYLYALNSLSPGGMNLATNFFADSYSEFEDYDVLVYQASVPTMEYNDIQIDLPIYYPDYAIGAFAVSNRLDSWSWSGITQSGNVIESYPDNRFDDFDAIPANQPSSVYGAFYLSVTGYGSNYWRLYPYECDSDGTLFNTLHVQSVRAFSSSGSYMIELMIFCPHIGSTPSHSEPVVTTTAPSSGGQTIINNNVDLTVTHSILGGISNFLQSIWESIRSIPQSILNGIQAIFVPSDGFMDEQLEEVKDSFVWYEQIQAVGNDLKVVFGQEQFNDAPIVTLHASQMSSRWSGKQYMSEDELVLDFGEFADYRSSIHTVISVLLWAFFLWRLFARLPDIIHGAGIATVDTLNINRELDGRCDDAAQDVVNSSSKYFR